MAANEFLLYNFQALIRSVQHLEFTFTRQVLSFQKLADSLTCRYIDKLCCLFTLYVFSILCFADLLFVPGYKV